MAGEVVDCSECGDGGPVRSGDDGCRYCGILPDQDPPRPSYHEMRQEIERIRAALERIAQEPAPGSTIACRRIAREALTGASETNQIGSIGPERDE